MMTELYRCLGAAVAAAGLAAAPAAAESPSLQIDWSVNGGPLNELVSVGVAGGGSFEFFGESVDPGTGLMLVYNMEGDPAASLDGNIWITNELAETTEFYVKLSLPFSPTLPGGSELDGVLAVGLTTPAGGGAIGSFPPFLWQAIVDDAVVGNEASLFGDPFVVTHGGAASSSSLADFGHPIPVGGPGVLDSVGYELHFWVSPMGVASLTSFFGVDGCPADLDASGTIGPGDLSILLSDWGSCAEEPAVCPSDFDSSGTVDVLDLLLLLALWGPC